MIDPKRRALSLALPATLSALLIGPRISHASMISARNIIDDRGVTLSLTTVPKRIAAISYFGAETALTFGIQPLASTFLIPGRQPAYLVNRLKDVVDLGQRASPNLELLAHTQPDVIIAIRRYSEVNASKLQQISAYVALDLETSDDSVRNIALMGAMLNKTNEAKQLNQNFAKRIAHYQARLAHNRRGPRYAFLWGASTAPWAFYDENFTCTLLNRLHGVNVAGRNPRPAQRSNTAFQMSLEALILARPEIIFVYDNSPAHGFETNPVWQHLAAARAMRIVRVDDHWIEAFGPIARHAVLAQAAAYFYPDLFAPPDLQAIAANYLKPAA